LQSRVPLTIGKRNKKQVYIRESSCKVGKVQKQLHGEKSCSQNYSLVLNLQLGHSLGRIERNFLALPLITRRANTYYRIQELQRKNGNLLIIKIFSLVSNQN